MKETKAIEQMWRYISMTGVGDILMGLSLISYFFILKGLEERSFRLSAQGMLFADVEVSACHWSIIKQMACGDPGECCQHLRTKMARQLRSLDPESCLADAEQVFVRVQPRIIYPFMDAIDALCEGCLSVQDAFEAVLLWAEGEGAFQHRAGQIMTPLHIAYLMADLVRPQAHERVIDTSCGSGNLLVAAWQHMQRSHASHSLILDTGHVLSKKIGSCSSEPALLGFDFDSMMLPPCYAHLLLSGVYKPRIRTFQDWNEATPGFMEADLVAPCGTQAEGSFLYTLTLTDIATGWTECFPLLNRGQEAVVAALGRVRQLLPFPLLGIDTDNGVEFINMELMAYCEQEHITFTRGRPRRSNDQCFVEQKNGQIVRQVVGYDRFTGERACRQLTELYRALRVYVNCFQPSMKRKPQRARW